MYIVEDIFFLWISFYAPRWNLHIQKNVIFTQTTKICIDEIKWFHSNKIILQKNVLTVTITQYLIWF